MSDRAAALAFVANTTWAIKESAVDAQIRALSSPHWDPGTLQAARSVVKRSASGRGGTVGVLAVHGVITHRPNIWSMIFGGTSIVELRAALRELLEDNVDWIIVEFDSPGGEASGVVEFAAELRAAGERKPTIALVNTMAASAAYWLACQCHEIYVTPSGEVGSVGVFGVHTDVSRLNERIGIKPTYIRAGQFKVEGNPDEPLSDEARAYFQGRIDATYAQFVTDVARGRGLTEAIVRKTFGEGRIVDAADALRRKMVDRLFPVLDEAFAYAATTAAPRLRGYIRTQAEFALARGEALPGGVRAEQFFSDEERQQRIRRDHDMLKLACGS